MYFIKLGYLLGKLALLNYAKIAGIDIIFHKVKSDASVNKGDSRPIVMYGHGVHPYFGHPLDIEGSSDESIGDQSGKFIVGCPIDISIDSNLQSGGHVEIQPEA